MLLSTSCNWCEANTSDIWIISHQDNLPIQTITQIEETGQKDLNSGKVAIGCWQQRHEYFTQRGSCEGLFQDLLLFIYTSMAIVP